MMRLWPVIAGVGILTAALIPGASSSAELKIRLTWGEHSPNRTPFYLKLVPQNVTVSKPTGYQLEAGDSFRDGAWQTTAGQADVDGVEFTLQYAPEEVSIIQDMHVIWADLIARSDSDTARRLLSDAAFRKDGRKITIQMDPNGTKGFTVTVDQILQSGELWIPSLDVFLTTSGQSLAEYQKTLEPWRGLRVLDQLHAGKEANYDQYASVWEDMGSPTYVRAQQPKPGHIIGLTWDSAIPKFGIDRGSGVWSDYGNPDHFRFWFGFGSVDDGIVASWRGQRLTDGLPVVTTSLEQDGVRYEVEQLAYPLNGPPAERNGDIAMVLLQKVRLTDLTGKPHRAAVSLNHQRELANDWNKNLTLETRNGEFLIENAGQRSVLFSVRGVDDALAWGGVSDYQKEMRRVNATVFLDLPAGGSREFIVKLPSPTVPQELIPVLLGIDYDTARTATLRFWNGWLDQGAHFQVPEQIVNNLYRANLWHSLTLPRRHGGSAKDVQIDLPYSNFAYSQTGTPWPVNQAVYVDYMIYDLRGYFGVSAEELAAMFRNNEEDDGHVGGWANWFAYTPGMFYAVAKHYELSGERTDLNRLLPDALKGLDWTLKRLKEGTAIEGPTRGLVTGPLNDGTGQGVWAFNQAYLYAGLNEFGKVLKEIGHPRAAECLAAARSLRQSIDVAFHSAMMHSSVVQLRDHTWTPYVPSEALTFGRILAQWYPADVDTGALHLVRLGAVPASGDLATSLLNDHEDNLFLFGRGLANEPVYNQQATAYLLRDDPEAAIRAFYSLMAGGFSQSTLEPVEHRWTQGQYFGPPSTDGAWAESYRNMLIRETEDEGLFLGQATPRAWLEDGKEIKVSRAPTEYGELSFRIVSEADRGMVRAEVEMPTRRRPETLRIRLRHPTHDLIRSVTLNGKSWDRFNAEKEWIDIPTPGEKRYSIEAHYR
jgi:hypothetical protein